MKNDEMLAIIIIMVYIVSGLAIIPIVLSQQWFALIPIMILDFLVTFLYFSRKEAK